MKPEDLTEQLKITYRDQLKSVVLYGSAAGGDHISKKSDYNILVILDKVGLLELHNFSKQTQKWVKSGNPAPLFFSEDRFAKSSDVFPVEFIDIRDNHKVLYGHDYFTNMVIREDLLRLELEHELKGKLIQLREKFLLSDGNDKSLMNLMTQSLSTFLVLFRNTLRLYESPPPSKKLVALVALEKHISFDRDIFITIEDIKEGGKEPGMWRGTGS